MTASESITSLWPNPPSQFRSAPFWSWNSKLDPQRLQRAIQQMHNAGMGGFFMHSRYGLKTAYLSDAWFNCVQACIDKARELGMKAYLYDEDRWPSGFAGGIVTREHPEYRVHQMVVSVQPEPEQDRRRLAQFSVSYNQAGQVTSYQPLDETPADATPANFLAVDLRSDGPNPHFNDGAYLDTLSAEAVAEFIRVTHQAYADRYGEDFGDLIPAIFTDEPNYRVRFQADGYIAVPYTPELPRQFIQRRGYDLRDHLVELFRPMAEGKFSAVRRDYYRTITELFVENFSEQVGAWCQKHNIALTGHMLAEGTLVSQSMAVGACMPHYEHMQWPGIDVLRDRSELTTAKQCTSVADQLGQQRTLSELYGCTGWDWPLEGHKYVGDWHVAAGINLRCPHLTHYSLAGGAKRDYPASIFAHSPWWTHYRYVEDYFGRLNAMCTRGKPIRDVLVIHPIESGWGLLAAQQLDENEPIRDIDERLSRLIHALTGEHYDWDFGDESILASHAKVARGRLQVGRMSYAAVIVPHCWTLRASTVDLLDKLLEAGGTVLVLGDELTMIDGAPVDSGGILPNAPRCGNDWLDALSQAVDRRVSITSDPGTEDHDIWAMLRDVDGQRLLFVQSHRRDAGKELRIRCQGDGPVVSWDALTGNRTIIPAEQDGDCMVFPLSLPATGSALLSLGMEVDEAAEPTPPGETIRTESLPGPYAIELSEPNTMPLDRCQYRVGESDWSEPVDILEADRAIRAGFDLPPRSNAGAQPWYLYDTGVIDLTPRGQISLRWTFHVGQVPAACKLAMESPEAFDLEVNGQAPPKPEGWWVDEDFRTMDVADLLSQGVNEIVLSCNYRPDMELEALYLVGDFGVEQTGSEKLPENYRLTASPKTLAPGSWVSQGLDFYTGAVRYRLKVARPETGRALLRLPEVSCTAAMIRAGDSEFFLPWPPFQADITDALGQDENEVIVEVIGGRKNTLGPLHTPWRGWTGPGEFMPGNEQWSDAYILNDHGLMQPPVLEIRQ